jgi:hypothetical protein
MDPHKLELKSYLTPESARSLDAEALIPVLHRWIKQRARPELMIDVASDTDATLAALRPELEALARTLFTGPFDLKCVAARRNGSPSQSQMERARRWRRCSSARAVRPAPTRR